MCTAHVGRQILAATDEEETRRVVWRGTGADGGGHEGEDRPPIVRTVEVGPVQELAMRTPEPAAATSASAEEEEAAIFL